MGGPLDGVRVLDFTCNLPGPYASFLLARQGATVTKVEPPRGDPARHSPGLFGRVNQGKQSLRLDLREPSDVAQAQELVAESDVLLEGFRPGKMAKLGFGATQALELNPRLVYCSISAYGQDGPRRDEPGHDLNAQSLSGVLSLGEHGDSAPRGLPIPVADLSAAMDASQRIVAALLARERTGAGAVLDVAMTDTISEWAELWGEGIRLDQLARKVLPKQSHTVAGPFFRRLRRQGIHALPHYDVFRCRDGRFVALGVVDEDPFWKATCRVLGLRGVGRLPMGARAALGPSLRRLVALRLAMRSAGHWLRLLEAAGVPATPVHSLDEARGERHGRPVGWPAVYADGTPMGEAPPKG